MPVTTEELVINIGPQHPSTHGVFRAILKLAGERIVEMEPVIGYLHRGIEKQAEKRTYHQFIPYVDRLDYLAAMLNEFGYVLAVERLAGIEPPPRAEYLRVIMAELNRIASHLVAIGTFGLDLGALTPFLYCYREREKILDLMVMACGGRLLYNYFRIGGVARDVPAEFFPALERLLGELPSWIDEYEAMLTGNEIFLARTRGVGRLSAELALAYGCSGPVLRGSGVAYDVRRADPYSIYRHFRFEIPVGTQGDCFDRYLVRIKEMRESVRILQQAVSEVPPGPVSTGKAPHLVKPQAGEAFAHVEGARGDLGFYVVSDGTTIPYRVRVRGPSFHNLSVLPRLVEGASLADFFAIFGSLDVLMGEVDL